MKPLLTAAILFIALQLSSQKPVGIFENTTDVGPVRQKGSTTFDPARQTYQMKGAGTNIWFDKDEFHFAYKKLNGDFILQARGKLTGKSTDPHRKFGWMVRTSLDTNSAMVAAAVHGNGLAAFQFRKKQGMPVQEIKSPVKMPDVIQLEKRGRSFFMSVATFGQPFWTVEIPDLDFPAELLAGLFISAHHPEAFEEVTFDNVRIVIPPKEGFVPYKDYLGSHIEVLDVVSGRREIVFTASNSLQAPNWLPDDKGLIYNSDGLIYRFDFATGKPSVVNTDFVKHNNNDHVISFSGNMLGLSSSSGEEEYGSLVYTVPLAGGKPKRITATGPSYLHGWSPDDEWLTYTALRHGDYDIYKIPAAGGDEIRLTTSPGLDDGSEYSPDGKYIYFNSVRTGSMELWRMRPDGSYPEQLTDDAYQNWFPHISPDGKWIAFLSYMPEVPAGDHPFYKQVYLRIMPAEGGNPRVIAYLYGGQGTINTPSWSPDGKKLAFVSNSD